MTLFLKSNQKSANQDVARASLSSPRTLSIIIVCSPVVLLDTWLQNKSGNMSVEFSYDHHKIKQWNRLN